MNKGTKVLINSQLCSSCTSNSCFEYCDAPNECNQTRIENLDKKVDNDYCSYYFLTN